MKRTASYTQCVLRKHGYALLVAWVPSQFAKQGAVLKIHGDDGWLVSEVHQTESASTVENHQMDYRKQRRASDI